MKKNMSMMILSCDKYSDLWDGHIKLLEQNWLDRDIPTYLVTDADCEKKYPDIAIISAGSEVEWSDRLAFALKKVKTDYVFVTLDDYYLIKKVNDKTIGNLLEVMEKESVDYIRLYPRPKRATKEQFNGHRRLYRIDTSCNYSVNLYSGIWKKDFLAYTVREPKNAWQFEVLLYKRAQEYGANCIVSLKNEFKILDVVRKGKLLHKSAAYFRRHPGIYNGNRETNTWRYEIGLTIQQLVARHTPKRMHDWIKAVLRKRGRHFYSDDAE